MIEFIIVIVLLLALAAALEPGHRRARNLPAPGSDRSRVSREVLAAQRHLARLS